jgi:hypothetical protein
MRAHEQRGQAEDEAIDGREIGRPLPGAIADEQLVLEQQRLGGDGADATGAQEPREGDQQVDGKDEDLSHRSNRITTADARKTARSVRVASHCEFATHSNWAVARGHNLKLTAEWFEPDRDVDNDEQNRWSAVYEYSPIQFIQLRGGARFYDGIPQSDLQNREVFFAELHGFF